MLRHYQRLLPHGIRGCDLLFVAAAVWLSTTPWLGREPSAFMLPAILQQAAVICMAWIIVSVRTNFYQLRRTENLAREFWDLFEAWLVTLASGALLVHVVGGGLAFEPLVTFAVPLVAIVGLRIVLRSALHRLRYHGWNFREVILVGRGKVAHDIAELVATRPHFGIRIVGLFHLPGESSPQPEGVEDLGEAAYAFTLSHQGVAPCR
jgi:putative colanic acid biosynthesis UDP-glucose lipid carrier transferase